MTSSFSPSSFSSSSSSHAFAARQSLSLQELVHSAPAAFAEQAAACTGPKYVFISTRDIVTALVDAGFEPTLAMQTRPRRGHEDHAGHALHMLRFQPVGQALTLDDVLGEIVLINSHDGRSAYQLRAGLFRPVCTNGMLTAIGDFGLIHVSHRGNVAANVVEAAQRIAGEFARVAVHARQRLVRPPALHSAVPDVQVGGCACFAAVWMGAAFGGAARVRLRAPGCSVCRPASAFEAAS